MDTEVVLQRAEAQFAYLFGSRAAGTARPDSDADIAVMLDRDLSLHEHQRLAIDLADAFGVGEVDLIELRAAPLELRGRVVQEGRLIFVADGAARVRFEVETRSMYFDYLPTLQEHTSRYLRQVAERGLNA